MTLENTTIAVTGSGGFIGRHICRALAARGAAVRALVRYRSDFPGDFQFDLSQNSLQPDALKAPVRAVVHCAWDLKARDLSELRSTNVEGTQWLIDRCLKEGVEQLVFVSSMAAGADARSVLGSTKWEVEKHLLALPNAASFSTVIAPGIVVGNGGAFLKARTLVKKRRVIPVFYGSGGRRIQTVYINELCDAIIASIENRVTGRLNIAEARGVAPTDFYRGLALLEGRRPLLFPFPGDAALLGVRALEGMGLKPSVSSDALVQLKQLHHCDVTQSLAALNCGPMSSYLQSLQRLAVEEGNADAATKIAVLAGQLKK